MERIDTLGSLLNHYSGLEEQRRGFAAITDPIFSEIKKIGGLSNDSRLSGYPNLEKLAKDFFYWQEFNIDRHT